MARQSYIKVWPLVPDDQRMEHRFASINNHTYHYLLTRTLPASATDVDIGTDGVPVLASASTTSAPSKPMITFLLLHGFPDLAYGWRYFVPLLQCLLPQRRLRIIIPDLLGYGRTSAPSDTAPFAIKSMADDLARLVEHACGGHERVVIGGHDWGGALAWHTARWRPDLVRAVFSVCTPYLPPSPGAWVDLKTVVASGERPSFGYQLQLGEQEVERRLDSEEGIRLLLTAMFGGRGPKGEFGFKAETGLLFDELEKLRPSTLLTEADLDFYVREYARSGLRGPLNWYRTRKINYDNDRKMVAHGVPTFRMPALFVAARRDRTLRSELAAGMDQWFERLTKTEVDANHWALVEPGGREDVARAVAEWFETEVMGRQGSSV